ncbi:AAA family ATPase [Hyphomicrobium sp.]|uniref:AAA family ATPase n=1 Tax=Hyphomicrobium sp. TaxID=82 RepID=UPI0039E2E211
MRKVLLIGVRGVGKTTLARALAGKLGAVHLNGDEYSAVSFDSGRAEVDLLQQARQLGWIADQIARARQFVVVDFVCSSEASRIAFQAGRQAFVVWVDRVKVDHASGCGGQFETPATYNVRVTSPGTVEQWASRIESAVRRSVGAGFV